MVLTVFEPSGIVTLLTDFGLNDTYVGQMKGVLLGLDSALKIVDLTHGVAPQDIVEGAFHLRSAFDVFSPGAVHVVVVDPGVGTERKAVCVVAGGSVFIGPDNGVLTPALERADAAYEIASSEVTRPTVTATFHGRDVFAPAAGQLASGRRTPPELGPAVVPTRLIRLAKSVQVGAGCIKARIVSIDRFGNGITELPADHLSALGEGYQITCGRFRADRLHRTFGDVEPGQPLALIGSSGTLELAIRDGSAAETCGLNRGDDVVVRKRTQPSGTASVGPVV